MAENIILAKVISNKITGKEPLEIPENIEALREMRREELKEEKESKPSYIIPDYSDRLKTKGYRKGLVFKIDGKKFKFAPAKGISKKLKPKKVKPIYLNILDEEVILIHREKVWDIPMVAEFLRVRQKIVKQLVSEGIIPYLYIPNTKIIRFRQEQILSWVEECAKGYYDYN
jgi:hypothetical protein